MADTAPRLAGAYVGTSGFSYPSWKPGFYPAGTPQKAFLREYAALLPSVELNATFYQLPSEDRLRGWGDQTPPGFRFAVKMNRRITHLGDVSLVPAFCERIRVLGDRLGPILVQLPASRPRDEGWLELFLGTADPELRYAFEFRNATWAGVRNVQLVDALDGEAPFRYLRLRQPPYDDASLHAWAGRLRPLLEEGVEIHAYFKHEEAPDAPRHARRLLELLAV